MLRTFLGIAMLLLCFGCTKKFENSLELEKYLADEDNGYLLSHKAGNYIFKLQYRPSALIRNPEMSGTTSVSNDIFDQQIYFKLSIAHRQGDILVQQLKDKGAYSTLLNTLAFGMEDYLHLYTKNNDTLLLTDYIYPRMYQQGGDTSILLAYPRKTDLIQKGLTLKISEFGLNTGEVTFQISPKIFINEPEINQLNQN